VLREGSLQVQVDLALRCCVTRAGLPRQQLRERPLPPPAQLFRAGDARPGRRAQLGGHALAKETFQGCARAGKLTGRCERSPRGLRLPTHSQRLTRGAGGPRAAAEAQ